MTGGNMVKMHVDRSVTINSPVDEVFPVLNNFTHWIKWSPWLIMEPEAKVTLSDDHKYYEWEGDRVGSGNMTILSEVENRSIDYDLSFLRPWKSTAKVRFELEAVGDQTHVTWNLDSKLPIFLFWMKRSMEAFVGMDYVRGLYMLKDYIETGSIRSELDFIGFQQIPGFDYIGIKTTCDLRNIKKAMSSDFEKLEKTVNDNPGISGDIKFSIYHDWNVVKQEATYTSCHSVNYFPDNLNNDITTDSLPSLKVYTIRHKGPYLHLGNAWTTLMNMDRNKEFKKRKNIDPFEIYISDSSNTKEDDLITDIHFPVRD